MKIGVINMKGGVGKSTISLALAQSKIIDANVITNDKYSLLPELFKEDILLVDSLNIKLSKYKDLVIDFGGFIDKNIMKVLKQVDVIVVPTLEDLLSLKTTIDTIKEIEHIAKRIIVVHNRASKDNHSVQQVIDDNFDMIDVVKVRNSKVFNNALNETESVEKFINKDNLSKYIYRNISEDINGLIEVIKGGN